VIIWVIGKSGIRRKGGKGGGRGKQCGGFWVLWPFCVFGCISLVVVKGASIRDCRRLQVCRVGTVGCWVCRFMQAALKLVSGKKWPAIFLSVETF
jgi:hypothetical protein